MTHRIPFAPAVSRASVSRAAVCAGVLVVLGACGNGSGSDAPTAATVSASSTTSGKPGATQALRTACVTTNDEIVKANSAWNAAVDSRKSADLSKATTTMTALAKTLRTAGTDAHDTTFETRAGKVAAQVDALVKAEKPAKTVDTTTYNDTVDDLTAYCTSMFPKPSASGSGATTSSEASPAGSSSAS